MITCRGTTDKLPFLNHYRGYVHVMCSWLYTYYNSERTKEDQSWDVKAGCKF